MDDSYDKDGAYSSVGALGKETKIQWPSNNSARSESNIRWRS